MKKLLLSALAISLISTNIYAECNTKSCSGKVTTLYMTAEGILYVGTDGDEKALDCAGGAGNGGVSNVYMSLAEGDVGKNAMYSLLLTAKTTGKPVSIRVKTGTEFCRILYVTSE